ncbi:MAG: tetratricopeptide repeat protein [Gemmatimonadota bacterium]
MSEIVDGTVGAPLACTPRRRAVVCLDAAVEVVVAVLLATVTLLYSPYLNDNYLGKAGVVLVLGGLAGAAWVLSGALSGGLRLRRLPLLAPYGAYLAALVLSASLAGNHGRAAEVVAFHVTLFLLYVVVAHHYREGPRRRRLTVVVLALGLTVGTIGVLQHFGVDPVGLPERYLGLSVSTLGNTNFAAHYLDLLLPLGAAVALANRRSWRGAASLLVLVATGAHMVFTGSQGGRLAAVIGLAAVAAAYAPRGRWRRTTMVGVLMVACLSPVAGSVLEMVRLDDGRTMYDRATDLVDETARQVAAPFKTSDYARTMRLLIWADALELIRACPWLGVGPGGFGFYLPAHRSTTSQRAWQQLIGQSENVAYHAHNEYLETWAEAGVFGFLALVWLLAAALWTGWRMALAARRGSPEESPPGSGAVAVGAAAALTAAVVHAAFSFNLQDPVAGTHLWVLVGLATAAAWPPGPGRSWEVRSAMGRGAAAALGLVVAVGGAYLGLCILVGDAYYLRGLEHLAAGRPNRAILALRQAVDWRGWEFRHTHTLGKVALEVGRLDEAEAALRRTLELHPNNPQAMRLLGRALLREGEPAAAATMFKRAVRIDPLHDVNYVLLGEAYAAARDFASAIQARQQALAFQPEDARLLMSLGVAYQKAGLPEEAASVLQRAASLSPGDGLIAGNLGAVLLELGRWPDAEGLLRLAIAADPANRMQWRVNLAQILALQGRRAEALSVAQAAAAEAPSEPAVEKLVRQLSRPGRGDQDE